MEDGKPLSTIRLTDKQIAEYQEIHKQTFGKSISKAEAREQGTALARMVRTIAQVNDNEKENGNGEVPANNC